MKQNDNNYLCPYCRWHHNHTWVDMREEEELIKSEYIGSDYGKMYYLDTKQKFKVKICNKCNKYLKIRGCIIGSLFTCSILSFAVALVTVLLNKFLSYNILEIISLFSVKIGLITGAILILFYILWQIFGPTRSHVKFKRAIECNAIEPYKSCCNVMDNVNDNGNPDFT